MIKKGSLLALVICLLLTLLSPGLVQAQGKLEVLDSSAQAEFPTRLSFSLSARSDVNITDIRLRYTLNRVSFAEITSEAYIDFAPSTTVDVNWTLEMVRISGLPPGSGVEYWWIVTDASGDTVKTPPVQVQFSDNRFSWRSLNKGKVTIYWYEGNESFAQELMAAASQALDRLAADTGASLEKPANLYIYASTQDLAGALIFPQEWTGGVAFTRFSIISIGIAPSNLTWGKKAIAHELAHLVVSQMTLNPYLGLPTWLDEGLAMYAEGILEPAYSSQLSRAIAEDKLISVRSLSSPFSAYAEEATLSYAESYSLVEFLIQKYGQAKMLELLNTFRQGSSYDGALEKVYGFDMEGLDAQWRDNVTGQYQPTVKENGKQSTVDEKGMSPVLIGVLVALAIGFLLALGLVINYRVRKRGV